MQHKSYTIDTVDSRQNCGGCI